MPFIADLKQPKPFYLIFFIELWERFGYYGMSALIVLFFVKQLGFTDDHADNLFGAFSAMMYIIPALGGYIGDRLLGTKRTIILGTLVLIVGYTLLSIPQIHSIYFPLAVIAVGVGLFKANPSSLLSKIYEGDETKLDSGFTLYYMAINIGSLFSMVLTPIISQFYGWHAAFSVCAGGLVLGLIFYLAMHQSVEKFGSAPDFEPIKIKWLGLVLLLVAALIVMCTWLLAHYKFAGWLILIGGAVILTVYFYEMIKAPSRERKLLWLCLILIAQAVIFFILYFQMPMSLNLFAMRNVATSLWGIHIEPATYQAFNSFWIMVLSPVLAITYSNLSSRNKDLSMPGKFALGTFATALGFLVLPLGATFFAHDGILSGWWLVLFYFLESTGELLVSALGLAMISRFVPERLMGFIMGVWALCVSTGGILAGKVSSLASIPQGIADPVQSLPIYASLFLKIGILTFGISIVMAIFVPLLNRLSQNLEEDSYPAQ